MDRRTCTTTELFIVIKITTCVLYCVYKIQIPYFPHLCTAEQSDKTSSSSLERICKEMIGKLYNIYMYTVQGH